MKLILSVLTCVALSQFNQSSFTSNYISNNDLKCEISSKKEIICDLPSDSNILPSNSTYLEFEFSKKPVIDSIDSNQLTVVDSSLSLENTLRLKAHITSQMSSVTVNYSTNTSTNDIQTDSLSLDEQYKLTDSKTYYIYKKADNSYISSVSIDDAISLSGDDPLVINSPIDLTTNSVPIPTPTLPFKPAEINGHRGKLAWKDDDGNIFPLVGAEISVDYYVNTAYGTMFNTKYVYTDENGYFNTTILIQKAIASTLTLRLKNQKVGIKKITNPVQIPTPLSEISDLYSFPLYDYIDYLLDDNTLVFSAHTSNNQLNYFGAAVQVFEGLYYYSSYAKKLSDTENLSFCSIYYPCDKNYSSKKMSDLMVCSYSDGQNAIMIPKHIPYSEWESFGHEYGHHLNNSIKFNLSGSGSHYINCDDIYSLYSVSPYSGSAYDQSFVNDGLNLAFSEAWPTYWAEIAQASFPTYIKTVYRDGKIGNGIYETATLGNSSFALYHGEDFNDLGFINNLDNLLNFGGEAYEIGLIRFLYEMNRVMGNFSENEYPNVDNIWDILIELKDYFSIQEDEEEEEEKEKEKVKLTFSDLYMYVFKFIDQNTSYKNIDLVTLSNLASDYWISPKKITTKPSSNSINIHWISFGTMVSINHSKAYLVYFDDLGIISKYEMPIINMSYGKKVKYVYSSISSSMIRTFPGCHIKVGISFSPHFYQTSSTILLNAYNNIIYHTTETNGFYTGPYTRIIWEGNGNDLTLSSLAGITLDESLDI